MNLVFVFDFKKQTKLVKARSELRMAKDSRYQVISFKNQLWIFNRAQGSDSLDLNSSVDVRISESPVKGQKEFILVPQYRTNGEKIAQEDYHRLVIVAALLLLKGYSLPGLFRDDNLVWVENRDQLLGLTSAFVQVLSLRARQVEAQAIAA